jgi:hypothetical protein
MRLLFSSLVFLFAATASAQESRYGIQVETGVHATPTFALDFIYDVHPGAQARGDFAIAFVQRQGDFDISLRFAYANYEGSEGGDLFLGKGDNPALTEVVDNTLSISSLDFAFIGSRPIQDKLSFTYSGGLGIGKLNGTIVRTDTVVDSSAPGGRSRCPAFNPAIGCAEIAVVDDRVPSIVPVLNLLFGGRYALRDNVDVNVQVGWRTISVFGGMGVSVFF